MATNFFCISSKRSWSFWAGWAICCNSGGGNWPICGWRSSNLCISPAMPSTASWSAALWLLGALQGGDIGGGKPENCPATGTTITARIAKEMIAAMANGKATELSDVICQDSWFDPIEKFTRNVCQTTLELQRLNFSQVWWVSCSSVMSGKVCSTAPDVSLLVPLVAFSYEPVGSWLPCAVPICSFLYSWADHAEMFSLFHHPINGTYSKTLPSGCWSQQQQITNHLWHRNTASAAVFLAIRW